MFQATPFAIFGGLALVGLISGGDFVCQVSGFTDNVTGTFLILALVAVPPVIAASALSEAAKKKLAGNDVWPWLAVFAVLATGLVFYVVWGRGVYAGTLKGFARYWGCVILAIPFLSILHILMDRPLGLYGPPPTRRRSLDEKNAGGAEPVGGEVVSFDDAEWRFNRDRFSQRKD